MRDATYLELRDEPDLVLQALVDGTMNATWPTREMAKNELASRGAPAYDFASYGVTAAIAAIERGQRPLLHSVPAALVDNPTPASMQALRTAKSAYDDRYPEGA